MITLAMHFHRSMGCKIFGAMYHGPVTAPKWFFLLCILLKLAMTCVLKHSLSSTQVEDMWSRALLVVSI